MKLSQINESSFSEVVFSHIGEFVSAAEKTFNIIDTEMTGPDTGGYFLIDFGNFDIRFQLVVSPLDRTAREIKQKMLHVSEKLIQQSDSMMELVDHTQYKRWIYPEGVDIDLFASMVMDDIYSSILNKIGDKLYSSGRMWKAELIGYKHEQNIKRAKERIKTDLGALIRFRRLWMAIKK